MATARQREEFIVRFMGELAGRSAGHSEGVSKHHGFDSALPPHTYSHDECLRGARALLRHASTHNRLAVEECNGPGEYITARMPYPQAGVEIEKWEAGLAVRQERVEKRLREIAGEFRLPLQLGGDPRGCTVCVLWPSDGPLTPQSRWYGVPA